jgi:hypothetical protein
VVFHGAVETLETAENVLQNFFQGLKLVLKREKLVKIKGDLDVRRPATG